MKANPRRILLIRFCYGMLLSLSGIYCLLTAFGFTQWVSIPWMFAGIAVWTAFITLLLSRKNSGPWLLGLWAVVAGITLHNESLLLQLEELIYSVSTFYDSAYRWGIVFWSNQPPSGENITWGILLLGWAVSSCVVWGLFRPGWLPVSLAGSLLPLGLCCVVTDTVPASPCLFFLLAGVAMLLLTHFSRKRSQNQERRLTAFLLLPVLLASWLLFSLVTPESYVNQSAHLHALIQQMSGNSPPSVQIPVQIPGFDTSTLPYMTMDLTAVGPMQQQSQAVMDVLTNTSETLYLRGQALDIYDGHSWQASTESTPDPYWPAAYKLYITSTVHITVRSPQPLGYAPYYCRGMGKTQRYGLSPWQLEQTGITSYSAQCHSFSAGPKNLFSVATSLEDAQVYLQLPEYTREMALEILSGLHLDGLSMSNKAQIICDFVAHSAEYSLNTPRMPLSEPDFALWFLRESDTGYCTHYATAAAVLLRAAGIPARYVTGYMTETVGGTRVTVTAKNAHAWVEYLDEDMYWKVLEATAGYTELPPETLPPATVPPITLPTQPTTQESTAPSTQATQPTTQATQPTTQAPTHSSSAPTTSTVPADTPAERDISWVLPYLLGVLYAAAGILIIGGQYWLRRSLRRRKMVTGTTNQQALARWRYARRLEKLLRLPADPRLSALAEKAKFSQHLLSEEELAEFDLWMENSHILLRRRNLPLRVCMRLIFALDI